MILEALDRISARFFHCVSDACEIKGFEKTDVKDVNAVGSAPSRLYRWALRWQDQGFWFKLGRRVFQGFLNSSVSDIGVFLILWGTVELAWCGMLFHSLSIWSLIRILSASVLLHNSRSCGNCMKKSLFFRWLLFDFCNLSEAAFESDRRQRTSALLWGVLGGLAGILGGWISPEVVSAFFAGGVAVPLFFAVPELFFTILLFVFPFFNLLPHPTWGLLSAILLCGLTCLGKAVCGKRQIEWGRSDAFVFLLGVLYGMSGIISYGSVEDGLLRAFLMLSGWFFTRLLLSAPRWRRRAFLSLIASSFICAVLGIFEYVTGNATLGWVDISRFGDIGGRVCSVFSNPNILAVFLLLTTILPLAGCFQNRDVCAKWGAFLVFFAVSACLLLTWSRGAWLAWLVAVFLFLASCSYRSFSILMLVVTLAVGAIPHLPSPVIRRFQSIGNLADTSAGYRVNTWRGVLRMLKEHPWGIGCGESAFRRVFPWYAVSGTEGVMHPHQAFLEVFSQLGVIGLLLFLLILWRLLSQFFFFCKRTPQGQLRSEGVSLFCGLIGALVMGLFDSLWYHHGLFWLFWVLFASWENLQREGKI